MEQLGKMATRARQARQNWLGQKEQQATQGELERREPRESTVRRSVLPVTVRPVLPDQRV